MPRLALVSSTFCLALLAGACADDPSGTACTVTWMLEGATDTGDETVTADFDYPDIDSVDEAVQQCKDDAADHADKPEVGSGETLHTDCECSTT